MLVEPVGDIGGGVGGRWRVEERRTADDRLQDLMGLIVAVGERHVVGRANQIVRQSEKITPKDYDTLLIGE